MTVLNRGATMLVGLGLAIAAHASINYSNITATITYEDNTSQVLDFNTGNNSIDFFSNGTAMLVGTGTNHTSATINISYDASSTSNLNQMDLLFTGSTAGSGTINFNEQVFDNNNNNSLLGSVSGSKTNDSAFLQDDVLSFNANSTNIHVDKTFTLDLSGLQGSSGNFASVGLIEQNAVPEPGSMAALAIGGIGLLARRNRK